jgi:hypothetical protein
MAGELGGKLLAMGKQNIAGLPARRCFGKSLVAAKYQAILLLCSADSRATLFHILSCSIPGGRESESTNSFINVDSI